MGRRGKSSIVHQCKTAINAVDRIGESKRDARNAGSTGIHSLKQKEETLSAAQNYVKWVRSEFKVKNLYNLREDHYKAYIEHLQGKKLSNGHLRNVETALRHLQKGMNIRSEKFQKDPVQFCPPKRVVPYTPASPNDRSYSRSEYEQILQHLPNNSRDAVMLSRELGMRIKEACNVRVEHFEPTIDGGWKVHIKDGKGITKGGRPRNIPVPKHFEKTIDRMLQGKEQGQTLIKVKRDTVRRAVNKSCKKAGVKQLGRGTHGFRHAYARERLDQLLEKQGIKGDGKAMIERIMTNRDQGRPADYGIGNHNENLFVSVKQVIDKIHEEIGHGKDRWDLAAVYMR